MVAPAKKMAFSLRENCKLRILKDMMGTLKLANPKVPNYIMVVDPAGAKIISSCIKMIELMEEGVLILEKLELARKKFPNAHAIYFMAPTEDNVKQLLKDFEDKKKIQYGNVHLFFTNRLEDAYLEKLSTNPELLKRILTLKEMNLDFLCPEDNLFNFDMQNALPVLFSKYSTLEEKRMSELVANKLATIIPTLFDYQNFQIVYNKNSRIGIAEKIAGRLEEKIKQLLELKNKEEREEKVAPVKIVILDRSFDPVAPLLHDYYYQGMVYDLLDLQGDLVEYTSEDTNGKLSRKKAILNDGDDIWLKYKYKHIAECLSGLADEFNRYVETNATSKLQKGDTSDMDLKKMVEIVNQMPLHNELLGKYTMHMNLMEQCMKVFNSKNLLDIGEIEQCMVTGLDKEGKEVKLEKIIEQILLKISEGKLKDEKERFRLIMIAIISLGLPQKSREELTKKLEANYETTLTKLVWLGVDLQKPVVNTKKKSKKIDNPNKALVKERMAKASYDLVRFIPQIENIARSVLTNTLDTTAFGSSCIPKTYDGSFGSKAMISGMNIASLRKGNNTGVTNWSQNTDEKSQPKMIFFVIGGITYPEIRILREIEAQNPFMTMIIGATAVVKPVEYIEGIEKMLTSYEYNSLKSKDAGGM